MGFGAGIEPGPLLTLVLVSTVRSGFRSGLSAVALPLLTDGPIIAIVVPLISTLPPATEGALSVAGGLFVLYLGVETIRGARSTELSRDAGN